MKKIPHRLFLITLSLIPIVLIVFLILQGVSYYKLPLEERFFHPGHHTLKPGGIMGHGLGIAGTLAMILGIALYMVRKRIPSLMRLGHLKRWLEFHIFLCTIGPIMILFHTSFKFGGVVAISFWCMIAVFISGIIGRFIYIQIPRNIEGRVLSMAELQEMIRGLTGQLFFSGITDPDRKTLPELKEALLNQGSPRAEMKSILTLKRKELKLKRKIERLRSMQELFRYWHVIHLPFAIIMMLIMLIHVVVSITFGYRWIF